MKSCAEVGCESSATGRHKYCSKHESLRYPRDAAKRRASWRAKNHRRRAPMRSADVTPEYETALRAKAKRCPLCKVKLTDVARLDNSKELDHIIPINIGGTHTVGNVRIICRDCNLKRPKDGSDYVGPVTLWAQEPGFVADRPPRGPRTCEHGVKVIYVRCLECRPYVRPDREADGRRAAELRALGWQWADIAREFGVRPTNAGKMARSYGDPDVVAQWPLDDPHCQVCGTDLARHGGRGRPRKFCPNCVAEGAYLRARPVVAQRAETPACVPTRECVDCGDPAVRGGRCAECWAEVNNSDAA